MRNDTWQAGLAQVIGKSARSTALTCLVAASAACGASGAMQVKTFPSTPSAISALKQGKADAVVGDYPVVSHTARESIGTLEVAGGQFATGHFGIGVSKRAPELKAAIQHALAQMIADQSYLNVLRNWSLHIGKVEAPAVASPVPPREQIPQLADGVLHVGIEMSFPPMEFYDELKKPSGADVELANELGKKLGVAVEFVIMPFDGLVPAVQNSQVDVLLSAMTITPEREAQIDFVPYLEMGSGMLVLVGNPKRIKRPEDLCGRVVALQEGTSQVDALQSIQCP